MKTLTGVVTSAKRAKTATVAVVRLKQHPVYHKRFRTKKKFQAHNEVGAKEGNKVKMVETRPISKTKHWRITEVIK